MFDPRQLTTFRAPELTARLTRLVGQVRQVVSRGVSPGDTAELVATRHKAISLHVYGADLSRIGSGVRQVYRISLALAENPD